jgi:hypothetical protein
MVDFKGRLRPLAGSCMPSRMKGFYLEKNCSFTKADE